MRVSPFFQNPVTISEECPNGQDVVYELTYTTDSGINITTCVVDGTECTNGTCHHELQNNTADSRCQPPVSQFSGEDVTVSVTAKNIVGRSNPAVSRSISELICDLCLEVLPPIFIYPCHSSPSTDGININILGVHIDTTNPSNVLVECTLNQPGYACTIDYGTDPSYTPTWSTGTPPPPRVEWPPSPSLRDSEETPPTRCLR